MLGDRTSLGALEIVKGIPIDAELSNGGAERSELKIFASPVRQDGTLLRFGVKPFSM